MSETMVVKGAATATVIPRSAGLPGRVAVTWTVGGGVLLGGVVVSLMALAGQLSGFGLLMTSGSLFVVGALAGFIHGAALGYLGRPAGMTPRDAVKALGLGALYAVPASLLGFVVTGWIAMTVVAMYTGKVFALAGTSVAWVVGAVLLGAAGTAGARALRNALARWQEAPVGSVLVAGSFGALLITFLAEHPVIWGFDLQVTDIGAVLLAALVTIWLVGPAVTVSLNLLRRVRPDLRLHFDTRGLSGLGVGLTVGVVLGLLALPFSTFFAVPAPNANHAAGAALVLAVSQALVDEVLLRLVLMTAIFWLVLRWRRADRAEAAVTAVLAATLVQVALYAPAVAAIGLPSATATIGYVVLALVVPAVAFGALFWKRGFGAALAAHAAAAIALALLAR